MRKSIDWNKLGLKKNPFKIIPEKDKKQLIWAGFNKNKEKFEQILSDSLSSEDVKLALIVSRYGGGKTHSSYFFSNSPNLPEHNIEPFQIIVETPQNDKNASEMFF